MEARQVAEKTVQLQIINADFDDTRVKGKKTAKNKKKKGKKRDDLGSDDSLNDFIVDDDAEIEVYSKKRRR
jgi:hypothetical protein